MGTEGGRGRGGGRGGVAGAGTTLRVKTLRSLLLIGILLAGVGAALVFALQQRLMGFSIHTFVEDEAQSAAEKIGERLDAEEKLLRLCASSDMARRYLEAPSYEGPVYEGMLRNLRTLVSIDGAISLAYLQSVSDHYYCCQSDGLPPDRDYTPVGQPWYDLPIARGGFVVTPPYLEQAGESLKHTGKAMLSAALPVRDAAGKLIGVAAVDLLLGPDQRLFSSIVSHKGRYAVVVSPEGAVLHGPHAPAEKEPIRRLENTRDYPVAAQALASRAPSLRLRDPESGHWVWAGTGIVRGVGWRVVTVFPEEALAVDFGMFTQDLIRIGAVGFALFVLLAALFSSRISRAEAEILAGCERYREMFTHAPVAVLTTDGSGRVAEASRAFPALTGIPAETLTGRRVAELVHPEDAARAGDLLGAAAGAGGAAAELRFMKPDGTFAVCDAVAASLRGAQTGAIIVLRDSTQEKRQARRVEEVEAELQELNRIMVQREFRVSELRDRVRELEEGPGGGAGG